MNVTQIVRFAGRAAAAGSVFALAITSVLSAQQVQPFAARLVAEPASITMKAGETTTLKFTGYDADGKPFANAAVRVAAPRGAMAYNIFDNQLKAFKAGTYTLAVTSVVDRGMTPVTLNVPVRITWPALSKIEVNPTQEGRLYTNVTLAHKATGLHADNSERVGLAVTWRSSNPSVATVDRFGNVTGLKPGAVTISAEAEGVSGKQQYTVAANPVTSVETGIKETSLRTGDVIHLVGVAKRANGSAVADAPITWSYTYVPDDSLSGPPGGAAIMDQGLFTANTPGRFTLIAQSGSAAARTVIAVTPRDVRRRITVTSRGTITSSHTSDLWPWTGKDGRDYCLVGTWSGDGYGMVFDVTDLNNIVRTDSIKIDARTINDVTVSPDGRYGVLAREGASNRINGVVILDLATPAHPKIASSFSEELTGGVHNTFATNDYLFAVSGGQKYVIIDVKDIYHPKYVSEYRHPFARLHDLWVHDGIAYSAQGGVGAVIVDVGNGKYGGSIEHPKLITTFPINSGHEIYPYFQKKTGKVYLFLGDEEMQRQGRVWEGTNYRASWLAPGGIAQTSGGYTHIIDFTDPLHPKNVARYHIEDFGSHDIIVEDDILYQAYYDGGVRLVDVSGEMLGNLHDQGREIAVFRPYDPQGYTANAPFVMNAMPWKGQVLFTDFNSGLWAAKLEPKQQITP